MRVSSEKRREQLIEAALAVAKREGVVAVSTRTVAAEAGATPGIVHYVFASMEELLRAMIARMADEYVETVDDVADTGVQDVVALLSQSFETMWTSVENDPEAHLLTYEVTAHALRNPQFSDLARWQYEKYRETAQQILDRVASACEVEWTVPVARLSRMLVAVNDGIVMSWLVDRDTERAREVYAGFIRQLASLAQPVT